MGYGRVHIAPPERRELERRVRARSGRAEGARRARLILMLAAGESYREIGRELRCSATYVARWKKRFQEHRLAGLDSQYVGRVAWVITPRMTYRHLLLREPRRGAGCVGRGCAGVARLTRQPPPGAVEDPPA